MKLTGTLPRLVWVLLGLLVISAFVFMMGSNETTTFPSADSFRPSGTRALYELLVQQGYKVLVTQDPSPRLNPKIDVPIGFEVGPQFSGFNVEPDPGGFEKKQPFLQRFVSKGGRAALFHLSEDFEGASETAENNLTTLTPTFGPAKNLQVSVHDTGGGRGDYEGLALANGGASSPAMLRTIDKGHLVDIFDGIIATNRFIGRNDNAEQLLRWLSTVAPPGARIVFFEASFGNSSPPTIFTQLGPWSSAAWLQLVFLFVVIVYTLGKPFGYPDEERKKQRGARDLVDAVAQLYRRARAGGPALRKIYVDADRELRNRLKLPSEASAEERDRKLPPELADTLNRIYEWSFLKLKPEDALRQVQRLDRLMSEFLGVRRSVRRKKRF